MLWRVNRRMLSGLIATGLVLSATVMWACSVPVFRYALERWRSDVYQVIVFHDGELTAEQQAVIDDLGPDGRAGKSFANVKVHDFDVNKLDPEEDAELLELWRAEETRTLPLMVAYYPPNSMARGSIWSGPPTQEAVDLLLDSPARYETARRVLKGHTAVWVFLNGGDKKLDDEKFQVLEDNLRKAEKTLKLPEIDQQDIADGLVTIDPAQLRIKFSAIRLSRDNPQEAMFIQMLLRSEEGLLDEKFADKPMAFPLFGRGRVLYALVGEGIAEGTILEGCAFLIGPCTCQVKAQNEHGVDMLTSVDWDGLIEPAVEIDKALPPLSGLGAFVNTGASGNGVAGSAEKTSEPTKEEERKSAPASNPQTRSEPPSYGGGTISMVTGTMIVLGLGVVAVILGSVFLARKET